MKNVSNAFKAVMAERTDFYMTADVTFANSTKKSLGRADFYLSGNSYTDSAESSSFPLGIALEKQISMSIVNDADQWSEYDFYGAEFTVYCCLDLDDEKIEKILLGTYTVIQPETYGSIIEVTAVDGMYLGDKAYTTALSYPLTAQEALRDSCSTCGVTLLDTIFTNGDYVISAMPDGITHRTLWGLCAMLAGGNARMDEYNRLRIVGYDFSAFDRGDLDGGLFDSSTPYASGDNADGGTFNPWDIGYAYDSGTFAEQKNYHVLYKAKNLTVSTDDVVVTGVQTEVGETVYTYGEEGYIIKLTNQLVDGNPQDAVNRIGALIVGAKFRPFEADLPAYPVADFGDVCYLVDRKQNVYQSIITDVNFTFYGFTTLKCSADSPLRNSSSYYSKVTEAVVKSRLNTKKQISDYDRAVQQLTSLITQSFGVFKSEESLEDGSVVYYMHNKPTRADSKTIWKMTANTLSVSTDGGQTWNAGLDSSGNAVVNVLSAIGIQAEWLKVSDLSAIGATIGGWRIGNTQIFKYIDLYTDMTASGLSSLADSAPVQYWVWMRAPVNQDTWVFALCYKRKDDYLSGNDVVYRVFSATPAGVVTANSFNSSNANISGGSISISSASSSSSSITLRYKNGYVYMSGDWLWGINNGNRSFIITTGANDNAPSAAFDGTLQCGKRFLCLSDGVFSGSLTVSGSKSRTIGTEDFGAVLQYCYETPSPMFGDIGTGQTDESGLCYVYFDPIFQETVSADCTYSVFLQKEGKGDIWVEEKTEEYFLIKGTANLPFSWECKVKQKEYEYLRLDPYEKAEPDNEPDLESMAVAYLNNYEKEILDYEETD